MTPKKSLWCGSYQSGDATAYEALRENLKITWVNDRKRHPERYQGD